MVLSNCRSAMRQTETYTAPFRQESRWATSAASESAPVPPRQSLSTTAWWNCRTAVPLKRAQICGWIGGLLVSPPPDPYLLP